MLDITQYAAFKSAGSVTGVSCDGTTITVTYKTFDPATGNPMPDGVWSESLAQAQTQSTQQTATLASMNALIADALAAEPA